MSEIFVLKFAISFRIFNNTCHSLVTISNDAGGVNIYGGVSTHELPLMPALVAGLSVFALLTMFHYVSVAHISPSVTFGFTMGGQFSWKLIPSYLFCQILGSLVGATLAMVKP